MDQARDGARISAIPCLASQAFEAGRLGKVLRGARRALGGREVGIVAFGIRRNAVGARERLRAVAEQVALLGDHGALPSALAAGWVASAAVRLVKLRAEP